VSTYNFSHLFFFHLEGYLVRIIDITSSFRQDLNISDSKLSLSSDENRGAAPLKLWLRVGAFLALTTHLV
jgi:hypothetical protein